MPFDADVLPTQATYRLASAAHHDPWARGVEAHGVIAGLTVHDNPRLRREPIQSRALTAADRGGLGLAHRPPAGHARYLRQAWRNGVHQEPCEAVFAAVGGSDQWQSHHGHVVTITN